MVRLKVLSGSVQQESGRWKEKINLFENRYERENLLPLHNIIKEGEIDYEQLKEITGRITSGNATIKRLDKEEEQGRSRGGKRAIEATILLAADERANRKAFSEQESWQIAEHQEKVLKEYKHVVPKDNIRFLGKLAELADKGIHIYYVLGNHDMWNFGYLAEEIGLKILRGNHSFLINNQKVYLGHGDALDPKDYGYHLIKWIYGRKINQHLFAALHPRWAFSIARAVSLKSRNAHLEEDRHFLGEDKEPIIAYCKNILQQEHYDFFLFGHRHFMLDFPLNEHSRYINVGDWQFHDSYVVMSNQGCELKQFK
jgi:UDP-2,3-diacylglucosamine hydrolase